MSQSLMLKQIPTEIITVENFRPFGQVIFPSQDGKAFDIEDAQLNLKNGIHRGI